MADMLERPVLCHHDKFCGDLYTVTTEMLHFSLFYKEM